MKHIAILVVALLGLTVPATAQQILGTYFTTIGPRDFFNSRGERITSVCSIIRQDRANFHRFGVRDQGDQDDPFFGSAAAREAMQSCSVLPGHVAVLNALRAGRQKFIFVQVIGFDGRIGTIRFGEGAG